MGARPLPDEAPQGAAALVARVRGVHGQMVDAVLAGDGLQRVAELAAEAAGGGVAIVVPRIGAVAVAPPAGPAAAEVSTLKRYVADRLKDRPAKVPEAVVTEVPITAGDEMLGAVMLLFGDGGEPVADAAEFLHVAALASLTEFAVEEAYRIRTGESGEETLQAHPDPAAATA